MALEINLSSDTAGIIHTFITTDKPNGLGKSCDAGKGNNHFKNPERCPKAKINVHGANEYGPVRLL